MRTSARCEKGKADDICQELRLRVWELRDLRVTRDEARGLFLRLASSIESRARRERYRQGALIDNPEAFAEHVGWFNEQKERETVRILALFNALEKLTEHERWLVKQCKIDGRTHADVASQVGVTEEALCSRLWRAMARLIAIYEGESNDGKTEKRGAVIAPLLFDFTDTECAAFNAVWKVEGRVPTFGGGPPNLPPPPPPPPIVNPAAPVVIGAAKTAVSAVTIAIVVVLLIIVPTGIMAIYYFWPPAPVNTANKGLNLPPVAVVDDVVPMPAPMTPPTSKPTVSKTRPSSTSNPSPPITPDEMESARRKTPRFLPSRK